MKNISKIVIGCAIILTLSACNSTNNDSSTIESSSEEVSSIEASSTEVSSEEVSSISESSSEILVSSENEISSVVPVSSKSVVTSKAPTTTTSSKAPTQSKAPVTPTPTPSQTPVTPTPTPSQTPVTPTPTPSQTPVTPTPTPSQTPVTPTPTPSQAPVTPTPTPSQAPVTTDTQQLRNEFVQKINAERTKQGLQPLQNAPALQFGADIRAKEITQLFEHTRPNGTSCFTAIEPYTVADVKGIGENIIYGSYPHYSVDDLVQMWMNSEGHRKNILTPTFNYTNIGVELYNGSLYAIQFFYNELPQ